MCRKCVIIKWINIFLGIYFRGYWGEAILHRYWERAHENIKHIQEREQEQDQIMLLSVI